MSSSDETLLTGYSGRLFVSLSLGWLGLQFGRQLLPPLLPAIIDGLSISPFQAGFALTVTWGASALVQYLGGRLADGLSRKTVLVASLALMLSGLATLSNTWSYAALLAGGALLGTGMGPYLITARTLTSDLFERARGRALGAQQAIGICGSVLAGGVAAVVLEVASWRVAFLPVIGVLAVVAVLLHRWSAEPYVVARVRLSPWPSMRRVFGTPAVRHVVVVYALFAFAWQGVLSFLPTFLQAEKGFSAGLASLCFAGVFVVGVPVAPTAGSLSDSLDRVGVGAAALFVSGGGLVGLVLLDGRALVVGSVVVFAVGVMAYPSVLQAYLMDVFPDDSRGTDFGTFRTVYVGVASSAPASVGFLAETAGFDAAFSVLVASLVLGGLVLVGR